MAKTQKVEATKRSLATGFTVYKAKKSITITGGSLSVEIRDGALVVMSAGGIVFVFGPGEWSTVNQEPL